MWKNRQEILSYMIWVLDRYYRKAINLKPYKLLCTSLGYLYITWLFINCVRLLPFERALANVSNHILILNYLHGVHAFNSIHLTYIK